jgi:hypothetical protein
MYADAFIAHEDVAEAEDERLSGFCGDFQNDSLGG